MRKEHLLVWMLILFCIPFSVVAQTRVITGKILNESDEPVPLATIQQKGSTNAVTADEQGSFTLSVTGNKPVLVVSSVNYETQTVPVANRSAVNVRMVAAGKLSEVVVTALGITRQKRSLGYSSQSVDAKQLTESHQSNLLNALQGKVAGVTITSSGGGPGQGASIVIRGVNTINPDPNGLGTQPLFVIDGIPVDNSASSLGAGGGLPA